MSSNSRTLTRHLDHRVWRGLAAVAASFLLSIWLVWDFQHRQPSAPLEAATPVAAITAGYLLEALVLNGLVLFTLSWELRRSGPLLEILWGALGALTALTALSAWSAGYAIVPGLLVGYAAAWFATVRCGGSTGRAVVFFLVGFVGQLAIMFTIIAILVR